MCVCGGVRHNIKYRDYMMSSRNFPLDCNIVTELLYDIKNAFHHVTILMTMVYSDI